MSLKCAALALSLGAVLAAAVPAQAQEGEQGDDRFFHQDSVDEDSDETVFAGSVTSTSFAYREVGAVGEPPPGGMVEVDNASPVDRVFTDLRLQLGARNIKGSSFEFRADLRGRLQPEVCGTRVDRLGEPIPCPPAQSGSFGGNEFEAREFYLLRRGDKTDVSIGRQHVLELAAVKFDGVKIDSKSSEEWRYIAFGGLYPARISRDVREDYPVIEELDDMGMVVGEKRITPITAGVGGAYNTERHYGSIGAVGIFPLADDVQTGTLEENRVFAVASGYFRKSSRTDIHHFVVFDALGVAAPGPTNITLGVNHRPKRTFRMFADVTRVDTETLNVNAQRRLEDPDNTNDVLQNNITVSRISQESARAGISSALKESRYELSVLGGYRRRPQIVLQDPDDGAMAEVTFPKAQAVDVTLQAVDRRLLKKYRVGLSGTRSFGVGGSNLNRSAALIGRANVVTEFKEGKGELDVNVTYSVSADETRQANCAAGEMDPLQCYGTSAARTISAGALAFYRWKPEWFIIGSLDAGQLKLTTADEMGNDVPQPGVLMFSGLVRLARRF